jgi:hypothetical protein
VIKDKGTVLVTIAGATASLLYATETMPARSPTASAAVCLGSLIKFILPTLCRPLNGRHDARDHNPIVLILALVSAYVFVHVAMHGDTYLGSARKTSALLGTLMQSNVVVSIMTAVLFVTAAASVLCPFLPLWRDPPCGARGNGRLSNPPRHGSPVWTVPSQPVLCSSSSFEMERSAPRVGRNSTCSSSQRRSVWRPRR